MLRDDVTDPNAALEDMNDDHHSRMDPIVKNQGAAAGRSSRVTTAAVGSLNAAAAAGSGKSRETGVGTAVNTAVRPEEAVVGGKRSRADAAQQGGFPVSVAKTTMQRNVVSNYNQASMGFGSGGDRGGGPRGWQELCEKRFDSKKDARLAVVTWYSSSSNSSSKLIVDKWRESEVRYILRCQKALPKRSQKRDKEICQTVGQKCAMCVQIT
jgi:hypothetical protein